MNSVAFFAMKTVTAWKVGSSPFTEKLREKLIISKCLIQKIFPEKEAKVGLVTFI
jgi:hypothetical protein